MRVDELFNDDELFEDWKKVNRRDKTDGMSSKAVKAYRRENPGSKLQTAVTTKPSKLKKGSKSAKRRKSFCARMKGMKKAHAGAKTKRNPDSPINKALRRWNCESIEEMRNLIVYAEQVISEEKKRLDPKCWTGYKKQGTKMKGGVRVNNCVPVEEAEIPSAYSKQVPPDMEHRASYKCPNCGIANKVQAWAANDNECPTCLEPLPHGLNQMPLKYQVAEENKGLYYNVNQRKKAGISRDKDHPKAPTAQAWKDAAKTAKKTEAVNLDRSKNTNYPNDAATQKHRLDTAKRLLSDPKTDPDSRREAAAIIARMEPKGKA